MSGEYSVLVPAHDEERVLGRCLRAVLDQAGPRAELLVVANGCSDGTAQVARALGVPVLELDRASKAAALRAGEERLRALPRVYLDADVVLGPGALQALADALDGHGPLLAAPRAVFELDGRPLLVKLFYTAYRRLPYAQHQVSGAGVYALSAPGRARFDSFPDLVADDLFVHRLFDGSESAVLAEVESRVQTPRSLAGLLAARTRVAAGNAQLAASGEERFATTTRSTVSALARLALREPALLPGVAVYCGVTLVARRRARRRGTASWHRDSTTR